MRPTQHRAPFAVLVAGLLGGGLAIALVIGAPGGSRPALADSHATTTEESTTTSPVPTSETTTSTTEREPEPTTTTTAPIDPSPTTAPTTTAPPTTEAPPDTQPPPPPTERTTTTEAPPPPPPEDRTPPRQPGQAPVLQGDPQSQVLTDEGADVHAIFPLLSVGGFAALGGLLGAQWYLTKPDRRGGRTL